MNSGVHSDVCAQSQWSHNGVHTCIGVHPGELANFMLDFVMIFPLQISGFQTTR